MAERPEDTVRVRRALVSAYSKEGLEPLLRLLHEGGAELVSTGGTAAYAQGLGLPVRRVEELTGYPSILGGRVKTLHPKVFGGILARRGLAGDEAELSLYGMEPVDLVAVDLYPFARAAAGGASRDEAVEKIDIGGVSLIRAAAKNHSSVAVACTPRGVEELAGLLRRQGMATTAAQRRRMAARAFALTSAYDAAIAGWLAGEAQGAPGERQGNKR